jgi:hypothetical protein
MPHSKTYKWREATNPLCLAAGFGIGGFSEHGLEGVATIGGAKFSHADRSDNFFRLWFRRSAFNQTAECKDVAGVTDEERGNRATEFALEVVANAVGEVVKALPVLRRYL